MNHAGETKLLQANWRITLEIPDCLRQIDVLHWKCEIASGKLIFPAWFFNLPEAFCSRQWNHSFALGNWMSTTWICRQPKAFSCITYWRDTFPKAMAPRQIEFAVRLRLFCVSRIERIRIRRRMDVKGRRWAATWDWRRQNEKRSRMRLSSGSLRFSRRRRGALCTV